MQDAAEPSIPLRTNGSARLHAAALDVLPGGTSRTVHQGRPHPIYARDGNGCVVTDVDGNRYLDFYNNATSLIHGHAHPAIVQAIESQARRGTAFSLPVEGQIALARLLRDRIGNAEQVRFVNSGSEAVLLATQVARAMTGRPGIAKFEGLYHGSADAVEVSLAPDAASWGPAGSPASVAYTAATPEGTLGSVAVLPFNDPDTAANILRAQADHIAAVVLDVMPMRLAFARADPGWLTSLRALTRELGILLVSDEVVTFRLDHGGAQAIYGFDADLTVLGKIIGGGLPVGAIVGPRDIMRAFDGSTSRPAVPNAGTFNANPLTLAAGLAAMEALTPAEITRINTLGDAVRRGLDEAIGQLGIAAHTTGYGSLFGIQMTDRRFANYREYWHACVADPATKRRQARLYDGLLQRGILLTVAGVGAISTVMTDAEISSFVAAVADTLDAMRADGHWEPDRNG